MGEVRSYRPLVITASLYRCWATMRLASLEEWIGSWALDDMYAGRLEMGAVDAWREALTKIEELKLDGKTFCGGVAGIAKFFHQVRRNIVYKMAAAAGIPPTIITAYRAYIGNLLLYNCLAGGIGKTA